MGAPLEETFCQQLYPSNSCKEGAKTKTVGGGISGCCKRASSAHKEREREREREIERQADRQTDRHRQTDTHTHTHTL